MTVTGIESSATAVALARGEVGLTLPIFHSSVTEMPFESRQYDGIFCYGLAYLLGDEARAAFLDACDHQLAPGGHMIFTVVSKEAPLHGGGTRLIYDDESIRREFGPHGLDVRVDHQDRTTPIAYGSDPYVDLKFSDPYGGASFLERDASGVGDFNGDGCGDVVVSGVSGYAVFAC